MVAASKVISSGNLHNDISVVTNKCMTLQSDSQRVLNIPVLCCLTVLSKHVVWQAVHPL